MEGGAVAGLTFFQKEVSSSARYHSHDNGIGSSSLLQCVSLDNIVSSLCFCHLSFELPLRILVCMNVGERVRACVFEYPQEEKQRVLVFHYACWSIGMCG